MKHLLSISIGPVQDFISSARRSRDLWFGSHLLSELSKAVAKEIGKDKLIFPSISDDNDLDKDSKFNIVNKILAIVENPQDIDEKINNAIKERLKSLYEPIFTKIRSDLKKAKLPDGYFIKETAIAQINDMVEFYWAAYPYDESK